MRSLHDGAYQGLLAGRRVLGVTSTGAALWKGLLRDPAVAPGVLLVEEAGELLEAHVLSCLSPQTKHVIQVWASPYLLRCFICCLLSLLAFFVACCLPVR
jgi:hypothetical protein